MNPAAVEHLQEAVHVLTTAMRSATPVISNDGLGLVIPAETLRVLLARIEAAMEQPTQQLIIRRTT